LQNQRDIATYLATRIGYLYYHRPLMYGGTRAGVDLLLRTYHEIWAEVTDRQGGFEETWRRFLEEEDCGSASFSARYSMDHPAATEIELAEYVVKQWRRVSEDLGIPIPHDALREEFGG
jgi:hypothetical protein